MTYTRLGPFVDDTGPYLSAATLNHLEDGLAAAAGTVTAPPPSGDITGATDQAALQPLVTAAQATSGTLILQAGTYYVTGLSTAQSFTQPIIRGQGMRATKLTVTADSGIGIQYVGGSGAESGGVISDMTLTATGSGATGIQCQGSNGVAIQRVKFTQIATGLSFSNSKTGDFTEFCVADSCSFELDCTTHIEYKVSNGVRSFHGSGFRNCVLNQASGDTAAKIKIGTGALVYQAPFDGTFFIRTTTPFVQASTTEHTNTYGNINIETGTASTQKTLISFDTSSMDWYHSGGVECLTQNVSLGGIQFRLVRRYQANDDGSVSYHLQPAEDAFHLGTGATDLNHLPGGGSGFYSVTVSASNYEHNFLFYVWRDGGDNNGVVTQVAHPRSFDTAGYGSPTFDVNSATANLRITNASYPASGVTAYVASSPMNGRGAFRILS